MSHSTNPLLGWPHDESPFHPGESAIQRRAGVQDKLAQIGPRFVRGAMPDEHRELFEKLPFVVVGVLDEDRHVWASILTGPPGFIRTPDAGSLKIAAVPAVDDPVNAALHEGAALGILGIELATRRRNRVNGVVTHAAGSDITIAVQQSFGNCPKYIHVREILPTKRDVGRSVRVGARLSEAALNLIRKADTFFIASASAHAGMSGAGPSEGVDVSHRGGPAGFVTAVEARGQVVLTIPDYIGNFFFNTLGNIAVNPQAGLLFPDFDSGDVLQLTGRVEVIWDGAEVEAIDGARRLLKLYVDEGRWAPAALPFRAERP